MSLICYGLSLRFKAYGQLAKRLMHMAHNMGNFSGVCHLIG